uniref:Uncharacterized protein n=1 Tax=Heterorhabditis bacteriophora TaxID=37862 RepID=A0A1I7WZ02_HETBA
MRYIFIYKPYNVLSACTHSDAQHSGVNHAYVILRSVLETPTLSFRTPDAYVILPSVLETPNLSITWNIRGQLQASTPGSRGVKHSLKKSSFSASTPVRLLRRVLPYNIPAFDKRRSLAIEVGTRENVLRASLASLGKTNWLLLQKSRKLQSMCTRFLLNIEEYIVNSI